MEVVRITRTEDIRYPEFAALYKTSFPIFEQRTEQQQQTALECENYHLDLFYSEDKFIGFLCYWEFDNTIYIEHFAVNTAFRGAGYGSSILKEFISANEKIILLEIDPLVDDVSKARFRFYQKCGFYRNHYPHTHPPYREGYPPHSLLILTTLREITGVEYLQFQDKLKNRVMGVEANG